MPDTLDPVTRRHVEHAAARLAEDFAGVFSQGRITVRSAGSTPAAEINPNAVLALEELGIDTSEAFPKPLTDEVVRAADIVINQRVRGLVAQLLPVTEPSDS